MLEGSEGPVVAALRHWKIGRVDEKKTVHFCGLVQLPGRGPVIFLPRTAGKGTLDERRRTASLTMRTLARFGSEAANREFERDGERGNPGILAVIKRLADDFRDHGLYSARSRTPTRNAGKPDWSKTIARNFTTLDRHGRPVFVDLWTSKLKNNTEELLAKIQAAVLSEIIQVHGWWLTGLSKRRNELSFSTKPTTPRAAWAARIDALFPTLYSARAIFLAEYLRHYLRDTRANADGTFVFGVSDFHTVWETVLRDTLKRPSVDRQIDWNSLLPKPVYVSTINGEPAARSRGMQTDIILDHGSSYTIVDAKYYSATSPDVAPGWPDIAKQMFYEFALKEVVGAQVQIRNVFVFPSADGQGPFSACELRRSDNSKVEALPSIECYYVDIHSALAFYSRRQKELELCLPLATSGQATVL